MHELPMIEEVLSVALNFAEENKGEKIVKITMKASCFSGILPKWGKLFFEMISKGTIAEGAELDIQLRPAEVFCHACKKRWYVEQARSHLRCPVCDSEKQRDADDEAAD